MGGLVVNPYALASASFAPLDLFSGNPGGALWDMDTASSVRKAGAQAVLNDTDCDVNDLTGNGNTCGYFGWTTGTYKMDGGFGSLSLGTTDAGGASGNGNDINLQGKAAISVVYGIRLAAPGYDAATVVTDGTNEVASCEGNAGNNVIIKCRGGSDNYNLGASTAAIHVAAVVDYQAGTWATYINNSLLNSGSFTGGSNSPATNSRFRFWSQSGLQIYAHYGLIIGRALNSTERGQMWTWGRAKLGI